MEDSLRSTAKGHTWEGEKQGVRALIDARVETLTSIIKHLIKFECVRREEFVDKAVDYECRS
jgi:hypothetical protein